MVFKEYLQRAAIHVQSSGREEVTGANMVVALFSEKESYAVYFLVINRKCLDLMQFNIFLMESLRLKNNEDYDYISEDTINETSS